MNQVNSQPQQHNYETKITTMQRDLKELAISDELNKRSIQTFAQHFHQQKESIDKLAEGLQAVQQALFKVFEKLEKRKNDNQ
jgi:hypothetical protein